MALGDYILCCECGVKLIFDGNRSNREWWEDRWGKEPEIMCPDCVAQIHLKLDRISDNLDCIVNNKLTKGE